MTTQSELTRPTTQQGYGTPPHGPSNVPPNDGSRSNLRTTNNRYGPSTRNNLTEEWYHMPGVSDGNQSSNTNSIINHGNGNVTSTPIERRSYSEAASANASDYISNLRDPNVSVSDQEWKALESIVQERRQRMERGTTAYIDGSFASEPIDVDDPPPFVSTSQ